VADDSEARRSSSVFTGPIETVARQSIGSAASSDNNKLLPKKDSRTHVFITAAGTGIGLKAARLFNRRGNYVIMLARNAERLEAEAAKLENATADARDIADAIVDHVNMQHPDFDMLFLNAGVTHTDQLLSEESAFGCATGEVHPLVTAHEVRCARWRRTFFR
jgi:NAD(P)-dependent dehydrogenase (short-subunit alcohol dehydrogenase family)